MWGPGTNRRPVLETGHSTHTLPSRREGREGRREGGGGDQSENVPAAPGQGWALLPALARPPGARLALTSPLTPAPALGLRRLCWAGTSGGCTGGAQPVTWRLGGGLRGVRSSVKSERDPPERRNDSGRSASPCPFSLCPSGSATSILLSSLVFSRPQLHPDLLCPVPCPLPPAPSVPLPLQASPGSLVRPPPSIGAVGALRGGIGAGADRAAVGRAGGRAQVLPQLTGLGLQALPPAAARPRPQGLCSHRADVQAPGQPRQAEEETAGLRGRRGGSPK